MASLRGIDSQISHQLWLQLGMRIMMSRGMTGCSDDPSWVSYAGLPDHPDNHLVEKYMGGRASGILTFGVKNTGSGNVAEAGARFQDALKLITRLVNIGDCKSLACHPASTTHRQLSPEEMKKAGVSEDMIRLSIGIEHVEDLIADLDQALKAV